MRDRLKMVAIIALLATGASGAALGQTAGPQTSAYTCPPGYTLMSGTCHPNSSQGPPLTPFSQAAGAKAEATTGSSMPPNQTCPEGYRLFAGGCYPLGD